MPVVRNRRDELFWDSLLWRHHLFYILISLDRLALYLYRDLNVFINHELFGDSLLWKRPLFYILISLDWLALYLYRNLNVFINHELFRNSLLWRNFFFNILLFVAWLARGSSRDLDVLISHSLFKRLARGSYRDLDVHISHSFFKSYLGSRCLNFHRFSLWNIRDLWFAKRLTIILGLAANIRFNLKVPLFGRQRKIIFIFCVAWRQHCRKLLFFIGKETDVDNWPFALGIWINGVLFTHPSRARAFNSRTSSLSLISVNVFVPNFASPKHTSVVFFSERKSDESWSDSFDTALICWEEWRFFC